MYQRKGKYYADFLHGGRRYTKSLKTDSRTTAKRLEREFRLSVESGEHDRQQAQKKRAVTFGQCLDDYLKNVSAIDKKSHPRDVSSAAHLLPVFGKMYMEQIKSADVIAYKNTRRQEIIKRRLKIDCIRAAKEIRRTVIQEIAPQGGRFTRKKTAPIIAAKTKQAHAAIMPRGDDPEYIKGLSFASITREITLFKRIFSLFIMQSDIAIKHPCKGIKFFPSKSRTRTLSEAEEKTLFVQDMPEHLRQIITVALYTGARRGELFKLQVRDVVLKDISGYLIFRDTKTGDDRQVPLNANLKAYMLELCQGRGPESYVFGSKEKPLTDIKHGFSGACRRAGIEGLTFHDLRHTFCTRLAASGVNPFFIMKIVGHRNTQTAARYSNPTEKHLLSAMPAIKSHQFSQHPTEGTDSAKENPPKSKVFSVG